MAIAVTHPKVGIRLTAAIRLKAGTRPRQCGTRPTVATRRDRADRPRPARPTRRGPGDDRDRGKGNFTSIQITIIT